MGASVLLEPDTLAELCKRRRICQAGARWTCVPPAARAGIRDEVVRRAEPQQVGG